MLPEERDAAYLWDMGDAARNIIDWVQGVSYEQFSNNEMLQSAVERKLEVFGEAAGLSRRKHKRRIRKYLGKTLRE